jgi:hypothetical protein
MERTDRSVDTLDRPDGNSLEENYSSHDIGERHAKALITYHGLHVENWGIDKREEDDTLIFDDKMDFRVWESDAKEKLVCLMDVKSKNGKAWSGRYNERHHSKYYQWVEQYDVPVYVNFCILDGDDVEESYLVPLHLYGEEECYSCTLTFPDGNQGVYIPVNNRHSWGLFREECL